MTADDTTRVAIEGNDKQLHLKIGESILDAAHAQGVDIDHACGGVCACSTCHIKILSGADCFREASDDEEDQLDKARDVALTSRLACQSILERHPDSHQIEITIPDWNVNLVQEGH